MFLTYDQHQLLDLTRADRNHKASARSQLVE